MNSVLLILGGNIENRLEYIKRSIDLISKKIGNIIHKSSVYESEPWGFDANIYFLNQVLQIETNLSPHDLLRELLEIEKGLGRERKTYGYSSRTVDIDILFYNNLCIEDKELILPHPRLHKRKFTLIPLCEIVPELIHPIFNKSINELLLECKDESIIKKF